MTVVVCTYQRPGRLVGLVPAIVAQLRATDELLVIDQSSGAAAEAGRAAVAAAADARVQWIARQPPGLPGARNDALRRARGDVVVFADDDIEPGHGWLDAHRAAYADPTVGAAVGRIIEPRLPPNASVTMNRVDRGGRVRCRLDGAAAVDVASVKGANMSFRRSIFADIGGFDEGYAGTAILEEADVSERLRAAGWRVRYLPDAAVVHHHDPTGGVRVESAQRTEQWRFRNTGYFVARLRPRRDAVPLLLTFGAIAVSRAVGWRDPVAGAALIGRLFAGYRDGLRARVVADPNRRTLARGCPKTPKPHLLYNKI